MIEILPRPRPFARLAFLVGMACLVGATRAPRAFAAVGYHQDVAPIFRAYCVGCHNDTDLEGELSLERYASLRRGGVDEGDPIVPGRPDDSFIVRSLEGKSTPRMPPRDEPRVPAGELEVLKRWIAEGAPGPEDDRSILETLVVPPVAPPSDVRAPVTALAVSPIDQTWAVGLYRRIELRPDLDASARVVIEDLPGKVNAVNYSPDGRWLVAATGITGLRGVARVYDARDGHFIREFAGHRDVLLDAVFSPNGEFLATAGYDRIIEIWDAAAGELLHRIDVHNGAVFDLAFDASSRVLASASADQTVKLWRVSDGERLDTLNQPQGEMYAVTFTPDGQRILAAGADRRIYMWSWVSREKPEINPLLESRFAHDSAIQALALSKDGQHLMTSALDRTVKLWSVPALVEQHAYETGADMAAVLAAYPDQGGFVAAHMDGSIRRLALPTRERPAPVAAHLAEKEKEPLVGAMETVIESEPNDDPPSSQPIHLPAEIEGAITEAKDRDLYRFYARSGQALILAVKAARAGSHLDSRVEVLFEDGRPVEQVVLRAVRDSWFTFRGKDSSTSDDFRLHNWTQMELNEYLYANGEVVKLWLYPRGPDSGFKVYPGMGARHTMFSTTPLAHALNEPCYIVEPYPAGTQPVPNGLPVFRLHYENDDDPTRQWGADSLLLFTAPQDGHYLARLTDVRGFGGSTNFHYQLSIREPQPDFSIEVQGRNPKVSPGSGREITFVATRREGFEGPIRIELTDLPDGFSISGPVEIEAGQPSAIVVVYAEENAEDPDDASDQSVQVKATAQIQGREVVHDLGNLGNLQLAGQPKLTVSILPKGGIANTGDQSSRPLEFFIRPGETISAMVRAERDDFDGRIELGKEDSGRNLPHGVFVDNIGLNGLLIVEGQTEREFFITASPVAQPGTRMFHLQATADGGQASRPAILHVLPPAPGSGGVGQ